MKKLLLSALALAAGITAVNAQFYVMEETGVLSGYAWDQPGTTILSNPANDEYSSTQDLPFDFEFYGETVTQYIASDNGYITFDVSSSSSTGSNTSIPDAGGPNNAIYAAWTDLELLAGAGTPDIVKAYTSGVAPHRTHVIQWHSVNQVGTAGYMYAAIVLQEGGDFDIVLPWASGTVAGFTIGCENSDGTDGVEISGSPNLSIPANTDLNNDDLIYHFIQGATQPSVDLKMTSATFPPFASNDGSSPITGSILNVGSSSVSSFDLSWTDGTTTMTSTITTSIASGETYNFEHPDEITLDGGESVSITVSVDATGDANADNNSRSDDVSGLNFVPKKRVFGEEATGTWCGWCPRGMVGMEYMEEEYEDDWVGIAVHNNDPMANSDYDSWMGQNISGYPSGLVDRLADIDPGWTTLEAAFEEQINEFGVADIRLYPMINDDDEVTIRMEFDFALDYDDDVRVAVLLAEDDLTGNTGAWAQANYYSGGGSGSLSGAGFDWHNEGSSVNGVTYNDVARQPITDVDGEDDIIEAPFTSGAPIIATLDKFDWDDDYDMDNTTIVVVLIDDASGDVINVVEEHLMETEIYTNNGTEYYIIDGDTFQLWDDAFVPLGVADAPVLDVKVFPNPSNGIINVQLSEAAEVVMIDMMGKVVASASFVGNARGVQINSSNMAAGVYNIVIKSESTQITERVTVIK